MPHRAKQLRTKIPYLVIPIFVPFGGCTNKCVFCNQTKITGIGYLPSIETVKQTIEAYLLTWSKGGRKEIAFYGGSFTAFPLELQREYLETAYEFVKKGRVDAIRISTRPDCITDEIVRFLKGFRVGAVELGAQSMVNHILEKSGRGHGGKAIVRAIRILKDAGIKVGIQMMPGLPGDTEETITTTARRIIITKPDFIRIYPTLVIRDTPLYTMYKKGEYRPWRLNEMVDVCGKVYLMFQRAGISIVRMGLQPTKELEENIVAGPYHPSFRQLVEAQVEEQVA